MNNHLRYRRQFLISKIPVQSFDNWTCLNTGNIYIQAHPDLEVQSIKSKDTELILLGSIFDAEYPEKTNIEIIRDITASTESLGDLFINVKRYSGNYALLYKSSKNIIILQDALSLREIYYCTVENNIICGSQPNLIAAFAKPHVSKTDNLDIIDFYENYMVNNSWIGDETLFHGIKHLLPNHYLDISERKVYRYWPNEPIRRLKLEDAVEPISAFLSGILKSISNRHSLMLAVTSGTDSRTLLAASKEIKDKIYYFVNNHEYMGYDHPDITVPKSMLDKIGIPFHIHDIPDEVCENFKQTYTDNVFFKTERLLTAIYNIYYLNHRNKVNITSTGEIGRSRYGVTKRKINSHLLAFKMGQNPNCRYVDIQCRKILSELSPVAAKYGLNLLTLLYWEQKIGNWGTIVNSESDIAIEEFDPYGSHYLLELLLGVDEKYTQYDEQPCCLLYQKMVSHSWPELMEWPMNPPFTRRDKVLDFLRRIKMLNFLKEIKYQLSYLLYLGKKITLS